MDQSIEVAFILVADIVGEASSTFAIKHHQLCEPGRFADRLSVTGNGLFGLCDRNILVTQSSYIASGFQGSSSPRPRYAPPKRISQYKRSESGCGCNTV